ncbi:MAG: hypothetical protein IT582_06985 [Opitutaceae bacterium]|nr:hypothetical protein [Opitutaceae bacterium]
MSDSQRPFLPSLFWCASAVLAAGCVILGYLVIQLRAENSLLTHQTRLAELQLHGLEVQIASTQIIDQAELRTHSALSSLQLRVLHPTPGAPQNAIAITIWRPGNDEALIFAKSLPPVPTGDNYLLWVLNPDGTKRVAVTSFKTNPATERAPHLFTLPPDFPTDHGTLRFGLFVSGNPPAGSAARPLLISD